MPSSDPETGVSPEVGAVSDMDTQAPLPADLRFLKFLVTTLTLVMILGLVTVVGLLVTRLNAVAPLPQLPDSMQLPQGVQPSAVTFGRGWVVVVSDAGEVLLFESDGGAPVQRIALPPAE